MTMSHDTYHPAATWTTLKAEVRRSAQRPCAQCKTRAGVFVYGTQVRARGERANYDNEAFCCKACRDAYYSDSKEAVQ